MAAVRDSVLQFHKAETRGELVLICSFPESEEPVNNGAVTGEVSAALAGANGTPRDSPEGSHQPPQSSPHGYNHFAAIAPAVQNHSTETEIHPELRSPSGYYPPANMMPSIMPAPATPGPPGAIANTQQPVHANSGTQLLPGPQPDSGDHMGDGRKSNKRELSQSKRAAQNRAAQRAFRQRKEGYIKKLEQQVKDHEADEATIRALQEQNYLLRGYVTQLQSHLMATQGDCPPPPPGIILDQHSQESAVQAPSAPPAPTPISAPAPQAQMMAPAPQEPTQPNAALPGAGTDLEQVAQAVANLGRSEQPTNSESAAYTEKTYDIKPDHDGDAHAAEELSRQLHGDAAPTANM